MSTMTRAGAALLLVQIVLVCPALLTPVTYMSGGADSSSAYLQVKAEFEANRQRVMKILEEREWYRTFLELLREELKKKGGDRRLIKAAKFSKHLIDPPRVRRTVGYPETLDDEADGFGRQSLLHRTARSLQAGENSTVEVSAALKVDGKVRLQFTKKADATRMGDSDEIINTSVGNTEILLSMKVTKKATAPKGEAPDVESQRPPPPPPPPPRSSAVDADSAAESTKQPEEKSPATTARPPVASGEAAAGPAAQNYSAKAGYKSWHGDYSQVQTHCTDRNYCLFGGTCKYYAIIDMQLCSCRQGYKGNRCELYDIHEVLSTLDRAHKRNIIGNGPIKSEEHEDVLSSVVESTAVYLLRIPNNYPSEQAMQLIESLLRH